MNNKRFKTPAEIIRDHIKSGKWKEFQVKENIPKKSLGETIEQVSPLANLAIPGLGTAISTIASLYSNEETPDPYPLKKQMRGGGSVKGYKQYNAPSHEQGGMLVNKEGVPSQTNPAAEIEGTESAYTYTMAPNNGSPYVFSDVNGTSKLVKDIINKYKDKNPDMDLPTKAAMEMEIKNVENINDAINKTVSNIVEQRKLALGGDITPGLPNPYDITDNSQGQYEIHPLRPSYALDQLPREKMNIPKLDNPYDATKDQYEFFPINPSIDTTKLPQTNINGQNNNILDNTPGNQAVEQRGLNLDMGSILRTAGLVGSGIDAFQRPDKEEAIFPDYSKADERMNNMNADLTQARQDVLAATNRASELNRGAASSYSQYRTRELSSIGNLQDQLGRIGLREQQMRNQILGSQAQYETRKAENIAQIKDNLQVRNLQNKARVQDLRKQFMSDLVHEGDRLSTIKSNEAISQAKIKEGVKLLQMIAPDFGVNEDIVRNLIKVSKGQMNAQDLSDDELILFTRLNK